MYIKKKSFTSALPIYNQWILYEFHMGHNNFGVIKYYFDKERKYIFIRKVHYRLVWMNSVLPISIYNKNVNLFAIMGFRDYH